MSKPTIISLLIALVFGGVIGRLCLTSPYSYMTMKQFHTQQTLLRAENSLRTYKQLQGHWPDSLYYLLTLPTNSLSVDDIDDGWRHQLHYKKSGNSFVLFSLGRDGKVGGRGLDFDLTSANPYASEAQLSLWEVINTPEVRPMIESTLVCVLLSAILGFFAVSPKDLTLKGLPFFIFKIASTVVSVGFVSWIVTELHIPYDH